MNELQLAGCVILNKEGEILLLHRNTAKRQQWEIPGGKLDPGEDAVKTAAREVREEMGIEVEIVRELGTRSFSEDDYTMIYTWFLAQITDGIPVVQEPATHDRCEYLSLTQLSQMADELSPNTRNFLWEISSGLISI
ncbi:NUDIX hydrolase [Microbispora sp. H10949]|uniref:NUDIX hydrolase n=1 Tax=Microbispora sp. H10949 TaxID=2729111 RepID=UPI0016000FC7|nr:NUDIX hydrolase [Microbispora sp. H10949]